MIKFGEPSQPTSHFAQHTTRRERERERFKERRVKKTKSPLLVLLLLPALTEEDLQRRKEEFTPDDGFAPEGLNLNMKEED